MTADVPDCACAEMAHVSVGLHGDSERPFVHECDPGEYDDMADVYEADVPAALMARLDDAYEAAMKVEAELIAATGYVDTEGRMRERCPEWQGDEHPGRRWWQVNLPASDDENTWPRHPATVGRHFYEPGEAEAWIASLPERFWMQPAYGGQIVEVDRSRLFVEYHAYSGRVSTCYRCGWPRDEHEEDR